MKTKSNSGLKVTTAIKAGAFGVPNHSRSGLRVKAGVKAGVGLVPNHSGRLLTVG